jgi:hypothetical protein
MQTPIHLSSLELLRGVALPVASEECCKTCGCEYVAAIRDRRTETYFKPGAGYRNRTLYISRVIQRLSDAPVQKITVWTAPVNDDEATVLTRFLTENGIG